MKVLKVISIILLLFFSFSGVMFISTFAHEKFHQSDLNNSVSGKEICLFSVPTNSTWKNFYQIKGYYRFKVTNESEFNKQIKNEEFKAYTQMSLILLIWLVPFIIILLDLTKNFFRDKLMEAKLEKYVNYSS
jgi:hypothetical protein